MMLPSPQFNVMIACSVLVLFAYNYEKTIYKIWILQADRRTEAYLIKPKP